VGVENMAKGVISELLPYLGLFGQIFLFFQIDDFNCKCALAGFTIFSLWLKSRNQRKAEQQKNNRRAK